MDYSLSTPSLNTDRIEHTGSLKLKHRVAAPSHPPRLGANPEISSCIYSSCVSGGEEGREEGIVTGA